MYILEKLSQNRRDFYAIYQCEFCDQKTGEEDGYDDSFFHENVIPDMECKNCGKKSGTPFNQMRTKYSDDTII